MTRGNNFCGGWCHALVKTKDIAKAFEVKNGSNFHLKDFDPGETLGLKSKEHAKKALERGIARLSELQEKLYAQDRRAILMTCKLWMRRERIASSST